jgi:hypothetical protein
VSEIRSVATRIKVLDLRPVRGYLRESSSPRLVAAELADAKISTSGPDGRPPSTAPLAPVVDAEQRIVDLLGRLERNAREQQAIVAELLHAGATNDALLDDDMVSAGAVAQVLQISKSAARMQMIRSGNAVKLGGLWHVPRSAIAKLYTQRNVRGPKRNVRVIGEPASAIIGARRR